MRIAMGRLQSPIAPKSRKFRYRFKKAFAAEDPVH